MLLGLASATSSVTGPGSCASDVLIDLSTCTSSAPFQNNLGGLGPDTGTRELRYRGVGQFNGHPFDLVVTNLSRYQKTMKDPLPDKPQNGCRGGLTSRQASVQVEAIGPCLYRRHEQHARDRVFTREAEGAN